MSRLAYYTDFITIPILVIALLAFGETTWVRFGLGLFLWSIAEYVIHRYLFHRLPMFRDAHDLHHAKPCARTGVTSWHSLAIFGVLALILPAYMLAGIGLGYLGYITAHHAVHHWRIAPGHILYDLKIRHAMHHHGDEANFGVVTTFWDRIFGTHKNRG